MIFQSDPLETNDTSVLSSVVANTSVVTEGGTTNMGQASPPPPPLPPASLFSFLTTQSPPEGPFAMTSAPTSRFSFLHGATTAPALPLVVPPPVSQPSDALQATPHSSTPANPPAPLAPTPTSTAIDLGQLSSTHRKRKTRRSNPLGFVTRPPPPPPPEGPLEREQHAPLSGGLERTLGPLVEGETSERDDSSSSARLPELPPIHFEYGRSGSTADGRPPPQETRMADTENGRLSDSVPKGQNVLGSDLPPPPPEHNETRPVENIQGPSVMMATSSTNNSILSSLGDHVTEDEQRDAPAIQLQQQSAPFNLPLIPQPGPPRQLAPWDVADTVLRGLQGFCASCQTVLAQECQSLEDHQQLASRLDGLREQVTALEQQQDDHVARENFAEAEKLDRMIRDLKTEMERLDVLQRSPFTFYIDRKRDFLTVLEDAHAAIDHAVEQLKDARSHVLAEAHDCVSVTTLRFADDLQRLKLETERLTFEASQIEKQHAAVSNEMELVERKIEEQTKVDRGVLEDALAAKEKINAEVEELRARLAEKLLEQQKVTECVSACHIRIAATRSKFHKQLTRLETTLANLTAAKQEVTADRRQLQHAKKALLGNRTGTEERLLRLLSEAGVAAITILGLQAGLATPLGSLVAFRKRWMRALEEAVTLGSGREGYHDDDDDVPQRLVTVREELNAQRQRAHHITEEVSHLFSEQLALQQRLEEAKTQKVAAVGGRLFREAARLTAAIKELQGTEATLEEKLQRLQEESTTLGHSIEALEKTKRELQEKEIRLVQQRARCLQKLLTRYRDDLRTTSDDITVMLSTLDRALERAEDMVEQNDGPPPEAATECGHDGVYATAFAPTLNAVLAVLKQQQQQQQQHQDIQRESVGTITLPPEGGRRHLLRFTRHPVVTRCREAIAELRSCLYKAFRHEADLCEHYQSWLQQFSAPMNPDVRDGGDHDVDQADATIVETTSHHDAAASVPCDSVETSAKDPSHVPRVSLDDDALSSHTTQPYDTFDAVSEMRPCIDFLRDLEDLLREEQGLQDTLNSVSEIDQLMHVPATSKAVDSNIPLVTQHNNKALSDHEQQDDRTPHESELVDGQRQLVSLNGGQEFNEPTAVNVARSCSLASSVSSSSLTPKRQDSCDVTHTVEGDNDDAQRPCRSGGLCPDDDAPTATHVTAVSLAALIASLESELEEAVAAEDYDLAAQLDEKVEALRASCPSDAQV